MKLFACIATLLIICPCLLTAQAQSGRKIGRIDNLETTTETIRIKTAEVSLSVIVRDSLGHVVKDLQSEDFTIYDHGKRYEPTRFDYREAALNIVLLFDRSGSAFTRQDLVQQAFQVWRRTLPTTARLAVMQFNDEIMLTQDWMNDEDKLRKGMHNKLATNGKAATYEALTLAGAKLAEASGRRIILLVTKGFHQDGLIDQYEAQNSLRNVGASLYVFSETEAVMSVLRTTKYASHELGQRIERSERELGDIAENTGGKIFYPLQEHSFNWMLAEIADELRGLYELSFAPDETETGSPHTIQVLIRGGHISYTQASGEWAPKPSAHPFKQITASAKQWLPLTDKRFERTRDEYRARRLAHHAINVRAK